MVTFFVGVFKGDIKLSYLNPAKSLIILNVIITEQKVDGHMLMAICIMNIQGRSTQIIKGCCHALIETYLLIIVIYTQWP